MKHIYYAWAIKNSICIICFTILAVMFNKWWIILFSPLLLSSIASTKDHRYFRLCDKCGKISPYAEDYNEALDKAKKAGWIHYPNANLDYCPECQKEN